MEKKPMADRFRKILKWLVNLCAGRVNIAPIGQEQWDEAAKENVLVAPQKEKRRTHTANYGENYIICIGPF